MHAQTHVYAETHPCKPANTKVFRPIHVHTQTHTRLQCFYTNTCLLADCLPTQPITSVLQGYICTAVTPRRCLPNLLPSQYTQTAPTSPSTDPRVYLYCRHTETLPTKLSTQSVYPNCTNQPQHRPCHTVAWQDGHSSTNIQLFPDEVNSV